MKLLPRSYGLRACLLGGLTLCASTTAAAQSAPPAALASDTSSEAVVRAYIAAYNAHDIEKILALLTPDFVWLTVAADSVAVEARGVAAIRAQLQDYFRELPSARSTLDAVTALGPWVTAHERAHWDGKSGPQSQASLSVYEVRGGRLRRVWYYPVVRAPDPHRPPGVVTSRRAPLRVSGPTSPGTRG